MKIIDGVAWGIITARGGSKSIPLKNIVPVCGKPLIVYTIEAAHRARLVDRLFCSTDHPAIAAVAREHGVEVIDRPAFLSGDMVPSLDVMIHAAEHLEKTEGAVAEILALFQPTSIFIRSEQIDATVQGLLDHPEANSSETIVKVPHQFHAHNQRVILADGRDIRFAYEKDREGGFNKQSRPVFYTCGNLIVTRTQALVEKKTLFPRPTIPVIIPSATAFDLDGPDDMPLAELMIKNHIVEVS